MIVPIDTDRRIVVTGVGLVTSIGLSREATWRALQRGESGVRRLSDDPAITPGALGAIVEGLSLDFPAQTKPLPMSRLAASEALADAALGDAVRRAEAGLEAARIGCSLANHMGDIRYSAEKLGLADRVPAAPWPWHEQWMPSSTAVGLSQELGLHGPSDVCSAACASSLVAVLRGADAIRDGRCDAVVAGGAEAIEPLLAAGFQSMRVLAQADEPAAACRPFDEDRTGFVMGEGAAMLVLERMSSAVRRGAPIYAELLAGATLTDTHHITSLAPQASALPELITRTLRRGGLAPCDLQLVSAHGTGTEQNDALEAYSLRSALGRAADDVSVTATKSALGHLLNAAGSTELAVTLLALRDGLSPPTLNLERPAFDLDCTPLVGRERPLEHALKTSIAFGGHLVAVVLRRWVGKHERRALPLATPRRRAA